MNNHTPDIQSPIDMNCAGPAISAFSGACGVDCHLISPDGRTILSAAGRDGQKGCACCHAVEDPAGCEKVRLYGAYQAERFGGRYIYFCPHGLAWCSSPILVGGKLAGSLACGPALIMDQEDFWTTQTLKRSPGDGQDDLRPLLAHVPYKPPREFGDISAVLLAVAVYIGAHSRLLVAAQQQTEQQQHIGETLHHLKSIQAPPTYPLAKERELVQAIREGDQLAARRLLNELLGHILFYTGGDFPIMRTRSLELMSILSRAAADGGADLNQVLALNHQFLCESAYLSSAEDLTIWITHVIERYTSLVFDLVDIKHKDLIYKAMDYVKQHYAERLTLDDTARYVGFSPTYFSKVFKDELHCTFNHYLNRLRIDKSKALLLSDGLSVSDVCARVGFEDQSYFIKVFRKHMGVTPGQYRRRQGRLDPSKERDT